MYSKHDVPLQTCAGLVIVYNRVVGTRQHVVGTRQHVVEFVVGFRQHCCRVCGRVVVGCCRVCRVDCVFCFVVLLLLFFVFVVPADYPAAPVADVIEVVIPAGLSLISPFGACNPLLTFSVAMLAQEPCGRPAPPRAVHPTPLPRAWPHG